MRFASLPTDSRSRRTNDTTVNSILRRDVNDGHRAPKSFQTNVSGEIYGNLLHFGLLRYRSRTFLYLLPELLLLCLPTLKNDYAQAYQQKSLQNNRESSILIFALRRSIWPIDIRNLREFRDPNDYSCAFCTPRKIKRIIH